MVWELSDMASIAHCETMGNAYAAEYVPTHGSRKKEEEYIKPLEMSEVMPDRKCHRPTRTEKHYSPPFPGFQRYFRRGAPFVCNQCHLLSIIEVDSGLVPRPEKCVVAHTVTRRRANGHS
jgi:hypothetical protein